MSDLAAALEWKYGPVADTAGDEITAWRHDTLPQPNAGQINALLVEYSARNTKPEREAKIDEMLNANPEYALMFEAVEDALGMNRGQLIANAKSKVS